MLSFIGSISWTLLAAYACKLNPSASAVTILQAFFRMFSERPWPKAIILHEMPSLGSHFWNHSVSYLVIRVHISSVSTLFKYINLVIIKLCYVEIIANNDYGHHLMNIITPAY